jgi:hypothetical protein
VPEPCPPSWRRPSPERWPPNRIGAAPAAPTAPTRFSRPPRRPGRWPDAPPQRPRCPGSPQLAAGAWCSRSSSSPPSSWPRSVPSRWPLPPPALNPWADLRSPSAPGPDTTGGRRGPVRSRSSLRRAPRAPRAPLAPVAPTVKRRLPDWPAVGATPGRPGLQENRETNPWQSRPPGLLPKVVPPRAAPAGELDLPPPAIPRLELVPAQANRPRLRARAHPAPARARAPPARAPTPRPAGLPARPRASPAPAEPSALGSRQSRTAGNPTRILPARGESDTVSAATELSGPGSAGYKMTFLVSIPSSSVLAPPANHLSSSP